MTLLERANRLPPAVCRLYAHEGRRGLSHSEIARKAGLSVATVATLSYCRSWKGVPIDVVDRFALACGVNLLRMRRVVDSLKRRKLVHIHQAPRNQRRFYQRLLALPNPNRGPTDPVRVGYRTFTDHE